MRVVLKHGSPNARRCSPSELGEQRALFSLHCARFVFLHMIVAAQMQKPVRDEQAQLVFERRAEFRRLALGHIGRYDDVAEARRARSAPGMAKPLSSTPSHSKESTSVTKSTPR